ncbi:DUF1036 domain-containing protein, partial [Escherichia coli]
MALERWFLRIVVLAIASLAVLLLPADAQEGEGWKLCNRTSYVIEAAVGHEEASGITVEGWTKLHPGACRIAL